jgi:hypothetical protein
MPIEVSDVHGTECHESPDITNKKNSAANSMAALKE